MSSVRGADELRHRLAAIATTGEGVAESWADEAVRLTRSRIRRVTGATAASVRTGEVSTTKATMIGSHVVDFLADGTRQHVEVAHGQAMKFEIGGRTIFSKRVLHPATRGDPRIKEAPREALDDSGFNDEVISRWNGAA